MKVTAEINQVLIEQGDLLYKYLEKFFRAWFWRRSTVTDGVCEYHTSNDVFSRCKSVHKNGNKEKWCWIDTAWQQDENWDTKWEIQKNGKFRIVYGLVTKHDADANDNINDCVTLHDADVNDNINDCVALHDAYTTGHFHWHPHERSAHSLFLFFCLVSVTSSAHALRLKMFESFHDLLKNSLRSKSIFE